VIITSWKIGSDPDFEENIYVFIPADIFLSHGIFDECLKSFMTLQLFWRGMTWIIRNIKLYFVLSAACTLHGSCLNQIFSACRTFEHPHGTILRRHHTKRKRDTWTRMFLTRLSKDSFIWDFARKKNRNLRIVFDLSLEVPSKHW